MRSELLRRRLRIRHSHHFAANGTLANEQGGIRPYALLASILRGSDPIAVGLSPSFPVTTVVTPCIR